MRYRIILAVCVALVAALAATTTAGAADQPGFPIVTGQTSGISGPQLDLRAACYSYAGGGVSGNYNYGVVEPQGGLIARFRNPSGPWTGTAWNAVNPSVNRQAIYRSTHSTRCYATYSFTNAFGFRDILYFEGVAYGYGRTVTGLRQESRTIREGATGAVRYI